ncbi:Pre-mRNA-splicing factor SPF27-like protein, partial [Cucurbita argyrosperma subsp. sororia]
MRRSSKRPADFLKDLPPIPKFKFDDHPMLAREYERTVRLQQLAQEQNEKMEKVNRERKFHQQNAASELHVLSTQWKELCQKNIEIRVVSSQIEDQIQDRRREAEKK